MDLRESSFIRELVKNGVQLPDFVTMVINIPVQK